jgi:hypothetical protein
MNYFANNTNRQLRVGYHAKYGQQLFGGLEVILDGFDIEYVNLSDYFPSGRDNDGK